MLFLHLELIQTGAGHTDPRRQTAMEAFVALLNVC